jgi:hypothetical protein
MSVRTVVTFDEQSGITAASDDFMINPNREASVVLNLTAGSPATGAVVQVTLDDGEAIAAGTAVWVNSPLGARTTSGAESLIRPLTGVRLSVTDGTWTLKVRQG